MKRLMFITPLVAFAGLLVYLGIGLGRDPSIIPSVLINNPVPQFELASIKGRVEGDGDGLSSLDLVGEVSLVNFWGSWCISCRIEHPLLMQLAKRNEIPIHGIDWKDPEGMGAEWLQKFGDPYAKIGDDADGRIAIEFGITGAPETFVIDKKGRIRYKYAGPITPQIWEHDIAPIVKELRNEAP